MKLRYIKDTEMTHTFLAHYFIHNGEYENLHELCSTNSVQKINLHLFLFAFWLVLFESLHAFYDFLERKIVAVHLIIHAQLCYIHSL